MLYTPRKREKVLGSKKNKGNRTRRRAEDFWRERGYLGDRVELSGKFAKSRDLFSSSSFGGFDIVALTSKEIVLIQVKTNQPATKQPYIDFAKKYASRQIKVLCMTWYSYKGWRLQWYLQNGNIKEEDLRK